MHISSKCTTLVRYPHSYKAIISSFLRCFWWFLCLIEPLAREKSRVKTPLHGFLMPCQFTAHQPHVKTTSKSTVQDHIHSTWALLTSWSDAALLSIHSCQCHIAVHQWYPRKPYQSPSLLPNLHSCTTI